MNESLQIASSIECQNLSVRFGNGVEALNNVSLRIPSGEILSLVGPSGCGKTTLLRVLAGLNSPSSGEVIADPPIRGDLGQIAFVFQQPTLLPWRTALKNVLLPLELLRSSSPEHAKSRKESVEIAKQIMSDVGLADALHRYPRQLSGGMRMRVSIARALVTQPRVLLLDEPFAALDEILRIQLGEMLLGLWEQQRFTAVMVTHNISEAILLSHRIALIREGKSEAVIDNALPWPRSEAVRTDSQFGDLYRRISCSLRETSDKE